jgi:1-aminocyclopropane-1-carboxylate deaminase/D-cysteine desulfhydrase-like pyridoxal-dependent ACC family enzyme
VSRLLQTPTPLEEHDGILVKREDRIDPNLPSGKLRGAIPHLTSLKAAGITTVVNAGATHSNSHAIVAYAAARVGLRAITYVNSNRHHPATEAALLWGAEVELTAPQHLGPLHAKARARADREPYAVALAWGLAEPGILRRYWEAISEIDEGPPTLHIVPLGAGGITAGLYDGLQRHHRARERIIAVPVMPLGSHEKEAAKIDAIRGGPRPGITIEASAGQEETPWPSDPRYEHYAWANAQQARDRHPNHRIIFWSIGAPTHD